MRVLWFTNTPAIAADKLNKTVLGGGWMYALGNALKEAEGITLGIAFYFEKPLDFFKDKGVSFYPIYNKQDQFWNRNYNKIKLTDENKNDLRIFIKIVERFKPDVIHIHGTEMPYIRLIDSVKPPIVVSLQGIPTVYSHFYFRGIKKDDIPKLDYKKLGLIKSHHYLHYLMLLRKAKREQELMKKIRFVMGRTNWDQRVASVLAPQASYFHNDRILREEFYHNRWDKTKRGGRLLIYTTTTERIHKGFETIIQAALLLKNNIGLNFEWRIGGMSKSDILVAIMKKVLKSDFPEEHIKLLGRIPASTIIKEMQRSDIYVLPSHIENSPNSLYEAMMLGMPCIATHAGGTISVLKDGVEGVLIQDGDPWSMAGAILELHRDKEKAVQYGINARKKAIQRHDRKKITENIIDIYKKIYRQNKEI